MSGPVDVLADYVTPVSVDTFGSYPGRKPGDRFEVMYHGKVYVAEVLPGSARTRPDGSILRDVRFRQVEGPVSRLFGPCPIIARAAARGNRGRHGIA